MLIVCAVRCSVQTWGLCSRRESDSHAVGILLGGKVLALRRLLLLLLLMLL